jgi:hypothetical protein
VLVLFKNSVTGPDGTYLASGVVANGDDKIDGRCTGLRE